jgi:hypothetical protein
MGERYFMRKTDVRGQTLTPGHAVHHKSHQNGLETKPSSRVDRHNGYNKVLYITFPRQNLIFVPSYST